MTVETDTIKNPKESPSKTKRKRASRSSSSGSSSSGSSSTGTTSSSSGSSRSSSSSSTSRSSSAASSPEKKTDRTTTKATNNKPSTKKPLEHTSTDDKQNVPSKDQSRRSPSPSSSRRQEKEKEATKIYIGKLSLNVNKEHLAEIFGTFGEIKEIDLPSHRIHPHLHRGFAHIEYVSSNGAEQACKYMEGGQVDGREIVCVLVHGQPPHLSSDRNRREPSPYHRRRRRSPLPPSRHYPPPRRMGDRDRDRGRYNDRRGGYSPPSRNYRRGQSPPASGRRPGTSGNTAESPKKKERRYSRSSSSESK
jgi:RNA-binding protein with serine-rich domain 1